MIIHVRVSLNPEEAAIAKQIGEDKTKNSMEGGLHTTWERPVGHEADPDINGFGAEMAFCKMINVFPDLSSHNRRGGYDCKLPDGTTVDVKQSKNIKSDLRVKYGNKKRGYAQIYALLVGEFPNYTFVGLATEDMVFAAPVKTHYKNENYTLTQSELLSVRKLIDFGVEIINGKMVTHNE